MSERGPVRVPLQSGATAWKARVAIAARFVPGVLITVYLVWFNTRVFQGVTSGPGSSTPGWIALLLLLMGGALGLMLIFSSLSLRSVARVAVPSDLLVTLDGFRILGGPHDGLAAAWRDVLELKLVSREAPEVAMNGIEFLRILADRPKRPDPEILELSVTIPDRGSVIIATAFEPMEQRALKAVGDLMADAIREARGGNVPPGAISPNLGPPVTADAALGAVALACPACQASVAPEPDAEVTCGKCGGRVAVPEPVRAKVRAAYELPALRASGQSALRRMLDAPGARTVSVLVRILGWAMLVLWPLAFLGLWKVHMLRASEVIAIALVMLAVVAAIELLDAIVRPLVIARHARTRCGAARRARSMGGRATPRCRARARRERRRSRRTSAAGGRDDRGRVILVRGDRGARLHRSKTGAVASSRRLAWFEAGA